MSSFETGIGHPSWNHHTNFIFTLQCSQAKNPHAKAKGDETNS